MKSKKGSGKFSKKKETPQKEFKVTSKLKGIDIDYNAPLASKGDIQYMSDSIKMAKENNQIGIVYIETNDDEAISRITDELDSLDFGG